MNAAALRAELDAAIAKLDEDDGALLENVRAVACFARGRMERFGGPPYITPSDIAFVLDQWRELPGWALSPHDLGCYEETLYRILGWRSTGESIIDATLRGEIAPPPKPLRKGEQPWRWTMPDTAERIATLVVLLGRS